MQNKNKKKGIILFSGLTSGATGYSVYAKAFFDHLINLYGNDYYVFNTIDSKNQHYISILSDQYNEIYNEFNIIKCLINVGVPNKIDRISRDKVEYRLILTASIQSDKVVADWINQFNNVDLVLTISDFSKQVMYNAETEELKLNTDVKVVKYGTQKYSDEIEIFNLNEIEEQFCYLFVGQWQPGDLGQDRKNIGMLIFDFIKTFKDYKVKPALILKTHTDYYSKIGQYQIFKRIDYIKKLFKEDYQQNQLPNIYLLYGQLTDEQLIGLYRNDKVKAMISITHGQGWGLPIMQFMLNTTKPVIYSNWSAMLEYTTDQYQQNLAIPGSLVQLNQKICTLYQNVMRPDSKWFEVNHQIVRQKMLQLYNDPFRYNDICVRQQEYLINKFNNKTMCEQIKEIMDKIL